MINFDDFNAGELRHKISFLKKALIDTAKGGSKEDWPVYVTCRAAIENLNSREYFEARAVNAENNVKFIIRYKSGLTTDMKLIYNSQEYNITDINDVGDLHRWMIIMATAVVGHEQF